MKVKGLRWWIIGLIFLATVINYIDRSALGIMWGSEDLEGSISILGSTGTVEVGGFAVNKMKTWNFLEEKEGDDDDGTTTSGEGMLLSDKTYTDNRNNK